MPRWHKSTSDVVANDEEARICLFHDPLEVRAHGHLLPLEKSAWVGEGNLLTKRTLA